MIIEHEDQIPSLKHFVFAEAARSINNQRQFYVLPCFNFTELVNVSKNAERDGYIVEIFHVKPKLLPNHRYVLLTAETAYLWFKTF